MYIIPTSSPVTRGFRILSNEHMSKYKQFFIFIFIFPKKTECFSKKLTLIYEFLAILFATV